jgi:hypothetical protein
VVFGALTERAHQRSPLPMTGSPTRVERASRP